MKRQLYYEEVREGTEVPSLVKHPTARQLVRWAGATGDYYEIHYDKDFAQSQGLPGVIVHGALAISFLGEMLTNWIGTEGFLRKLACNYRGMLLPGEDATCKGEVVRRDDVEQYVECRVWIENPRGETTTVGTAGFTLPEKG